MGVMVDLRPLRTSKPFRRLWVGRAFAGLGSQLTLVAVLYQVWQATGSTLWTGAVGLAQAVPLIGLGMFAGALVDRVDRREFYLVTLTGQAACSVLLAVQAFLDVPVVVVLALVAVQSCFVAGGGPAARTFAPRLLPADQLAAGLALQRVSFQGAMLLGPALGGLLLGWVGVGGCYLVDVATFGVAPSSAPSDCPRCCPAANPPDPGCAGCSTGCGSWWGTRPCAVRC